MENFGVKYVGKEYAKHLINTTNKPYGFLENWEVKLYYGIIIAWNHTAQTLDISVFGYIVKLLLKFKHMNSNKPQYSPYRAPQNI